MNKRFLFCMLVLISMAFAATGCKTWMPNTTETGKCAEGRQWVAPKQDPDTGEWKDGYCEWLPGQKG